MDLKTDLRLGLPGCDSPERKNVTLFGKELDGHVTRDVTSSSLFSSSVDVVENKSGTSTHATNKTQVVGWPPIRSFRKNTLSSNSAKNNDDDTDDEKPMSACLYVKVSMDGAPYLRKVDIQTYTNYVDLSSALENMFGCFITGKYGSYRCAKHDGMDKSQSVDDQCKSEYVLTYEDKDGDWMLVGDVPWKMFTENCRKLRIMKGSDAIGLNPKSD